MTIGALHDEKAGKGYRKKSSAKMNKLLIPLEILTFFGS